MDPESGRPVGRSCARCGMVAEPFERFCRECGEPLPSQLEANDPDEPVQRSDHTWAAAVFVSAAFAACFKLVGAQSMLQTYAAFIGLPVMVGMLTAYLVHPKTGVGSVLKITALVLCIICPLMGEGFICILMAAPIVFVMSIIGYGFYVGIERASGRRRAAGCMTLIVLPFIAAKLTSTPSSIANPSTNVVRDSLVIKAPPRTVWNNLVGGTGAGGRLPVFLNLGFPRPKQLLREADGTTRLKFDPGAEPWPGTNVIVTHETRSSDGRHVAYTVLDDGTKLARWMTFRSFSFAIEPIGEGGCRVTQTTVFQQRMQPGLYWNPLQIFAMHQMHGYILRNLKQRAETG